MTLQERYDKYRANHFNKVGSFLGCRSFEGWCKKNSNKKRGFKNYSLFAGDFETTYHKEFTDTDILIENRDTKVDELQTSFEPHVHSRVFLSGIRNIKTEEYFLCYENIAETLNCIAEQTLKERHYSALVWYHNLVYDGSYILKFLMKRQYKQTLKVDGKSMNPKLNYKEYACLISGGKYFNISIKWKGVKITFLDSMKLLPQNLASLGETIGFKKMDDIDYNKFKLIPSHKYPKKWLDYLERDCLILARILKEFMEKEPKSQSTKRTTIGAVSYSHIKSIVNSNSMQLSVKDFEYYQMWYHGGLTFPSRKYQGKWVYKPNQIRMVDACSMYPSQMIKPLPKGDPTQYPDPSWKSYCAFYTVKIKKATIKPQYSEMAVMPKPYMWKDGIKKIRVEIDEFGTQITNPHQYTQQVENSIYHFIDCEWELIKKLYDMKFEIIDTFYFETDDYLKETVSEMFIEKQTASKNDDDTLKLIAKLKLNNLYGKLGQKPHRPQDFYGPITDIDTTEYKVIGRKHLDIEAYNVVKIKDDDSKAQPVHIAAYITALARVNLIEKYLYIKEKGGTFLYCDTDSIAFVDKNIEFNDIGDILGKWEYEKDKKTKKPLAGDGFLALCPKQYRLVQVGKTEPLKFACAGADKKVMKQVKNQDYNYDISENKLYKLSKRSLKNGIYGKYIDDNTPFSFKKWNHIIANPKCPKELYN